MSLKRLAFGLVGGLVGGLAGGLAFSLAFSLALGLAFGLAFGLALGLALGLGVGLASGLAGGLALGLAVGLAGGLALAVGLGVGLASGLALGLTLSLAGGLAFGLTGGLALPSFFYITYFRLYPYPWHFLKSLLTKTTLTQNPYINDGVIWLPIWGLTQKLTTHAHQDPETGFAFVNFLQEYRPLQKKLAMHIAHAATAGNWQHHPLKYLTPPPLIQETPRLTPSDIWLQHIDKLKSQLQSYDEYQKDSENISLQKQQFEIFYSQLKKFRELTLNEPYRWHQYY